MQQRRWILRWTEKYKSGVEPYRISMKSRANKTKHIWRQLQDDHWARLAKVKEQRQKAREEARAAKEAERLEALEREEKFRTAQASQE